MSNITTLAQFLIERKENYPFAKGEFTRLMADIGIASKIISREINKAGIANIIGIAGNENIQGETQQKLDVLANDIFIDSLKRGCEVAAIASEEDEHIIHLNKDAKYLVCIDPLDGSSNIDFNVSIGTIFSIYRRENPGTEVKDEEFFQGGRNQVAAGYVIYGSSTMLVYTAGVGVNGFTLDASIGEFCLSHPNIQIPKNGNTYSLNEGNAAEFPEGVKKFVAWCKESDKETKRPYSARYIGSMVADFHRNMLKGGIFIYPPTAKAPNGKLRLLYECNPLAFIAEQAGGVATNGKTPIMDIPASELHQRTPIYIGSANEVKRATEFTL